MNKKLPFEEAFEKRMADLQLPQEDASWQQMSKLLDEKKRRIPLAWFNKYRVWGIIVLMLVAGIWLIDSTYNHDQKIANPLTAPQSISISKQAHLETQNDKSPGLSSKKQQTIATNIPPSTSVTTNMAKIKATPVVENENKKSTLTFTKSPEVVTSSFSKNTAKHKLKTHVVSNLLPVNFPNKIQNQKPKKEAIITASSEITVGDIKSAITAFKESNIPIDDSLTNSSNTNEFVKAKNNIIKPTISTKTPKGSTPKKNSANNSENISDQSVDSKSTLAFSVGFGFQQPIPVAGQQSISVGYNGKSRLSDYIPSVYLRLEKDKKYFLQAELNYAAPQLVKEFTYSRKTTIDLLANSTKTTTLRLQKTYYSEIPISFNYYVRPNWSVGVGGMYSWFHGAIAQQDTKITNLINQQQTSSTQLLPINGFTDSFLYRSNTYLLFQTDYQWKRFSFGLRYSRDLQPYIKYTLPDGAIMDKRNWALDFVLRFRLFAF